MENMTHENISKPKYKNLKYPFTELFRLLPQLYTTDDAETLEAIREPAKETLITALVGIESISGMMATSIFNQDTEDEQVIDTGWLIKMLGNLAKSCRYAQNVLGLRGNI